MFRFYNSLCGAEGLVYIAAFAVLQSSYILVHRLGIAMSYKGMYTYCDLTYAGLFAFAGFGKTRAAGTAAATERAAKAAAAATPEVYWNTGSCRAWRSFISSRRG